MTSTSASSAPSRSPAALDGFELLDACHRETLVNLGTLKALVARLGHHEDDETGRAMASQVIKFFSTTSPEHHAEEERHVFPPLLSSSDPDIVQAVQRLKIDHAWLEADWRELSPLLDAIACGQSWYDEDVLREGVDIFTALLLDHMALEESYIYPQARTRLLASERGDMGRDMAARRRASRKKA